MTKKKEPTFSKAIEQVLSTTDGSIPIEELAKQVMAIRMPTAKDPRKSTLNHIKSEVGRSLIYLDKETILPIHLAYQGIRFRLEISRQFSTKGLLRLIEFSSYYPRGGFSDTPQFIDKNEKPIPSSFEEIIRKDKTFGKTYEHSEPYASLKKWVRKENPSRKDHLLITILNWKQSVFQIEIEPYKKRKFQLLEKQDQILADIFFDLLEDEKYESIQVYKALPTAYTLLPEKSAYPSNHWFTLINSDPRMMSNGWDIRYPDEDLILLNGLINDTLENTQQNDLTKEMGEKIYRFKAMLKYQKHIWRKVEIKGSQTLETFSAELVEIFKHDWDHLSAFWKLIRRGNTKRFREVEVGKINPFENTESEGADTPIAVLGLQPKDRLKFVHDFGDWHEHILELEKIEEAQEGIEYPRVSAQNKPRYSYCPHCKENGEKVVATRICYTCSSAKQKDILTCDDCDYKFHEEHYTNTVVY